MKYTGLERLFYDEALDPSRGEFGYRWDFGCADCEARFDESDGIISRDYDGLYIRCPHCGNEEVGEIEGKRHFKGTRKP